MSKKRKNKKRSFMKNCKDIMRLIQFNTLKKVRKKKQITTKFFKGECCTG